MNKTVSAAYQDRKNRFDELLAKQSRSLSIISTIRLLSVAGVIYFIVLYAKTENILPLIVSGLLLILFFTLVSYHKNQSDKKKLLAELKKINEEELYALEGKFECFDDGKRFINSDHAWSYDLDLFGDRSIFQYMNRTATHMGPEKLAHMLSEPVTDPKVINKRQAIHRELSDLVNLRQHFAANARLMEKERDEYDDLIHWIDKPVFIESYKWTKVVAYIMTIISTGVIVAGILSPPFFRLLIPIIITNLLILSPFVQQTNKYQSLITKKHKFLETYARLQKIIADEDFSHPQLKQASSNATSGVQATKRLSSLLNLFDQRLNFLTGLVFNALFLFDFHMLHRLAKWKKKHRSDMPPWMEAIGAMDAQFSLANYIYNHPDFVFPEMREDMQGIKAEEIGHPMIHSKKRVDNTVEITREKVALITGANMAGKSTFLRSLGINMVLTYAGSTVCADKFITGTYTLQSSMRTADSLKDDESYFYAEIKRLKGIVEKMEAGEKLFILLDEVLKGTNTTDKQKGSRGLIKKSTSHDVVCFIATHDLALGEMQDEYPGKIINYCFESFVKELDLIFDYKIRTGIAQNMNASFLMKKMGIMD
ncbi:MAG TPA: hypothetical protein VJ951_15125 [Bacteroidales bacterium]|nr:hypothetical protein [Bacteroidales bacterium]